LIAARFRPRKWPEVHRRTDPEINYLGVPSPLLASDVVDETGSPAPPMAASSSASAG
jgi:hypothetical protein